MLTAVLCCRAPQALFRRHPSYRSKVREPIHSFYVVRNPYVNG